MDNVLSLLGLMFKAKKLLIGEDVLDNMNKVVYLFIASDASDKTKERLLKKCYFYKIDYFDKFSSEEISKAIGKKNIKVLGLIDDGFKISFLKHIGG